MISLLLSIVILFIIVAVLVWLLRYMGAPDIAEKVIVVVAVLILLIMLLGFLGYGPGVRLHG